MCTFNIRVYLPSEKNHNKTKPSCIFLTAWYQRAVLVSHISRSFALPLTSQGSHWEKVLQKKFTFCPLAPGWAAGPSKAKGREGKLSCSAHSWWTLFSLWGVHAIHCCPSWLLLSLFSEQLCVCCTERRDSIQIKIALSLQCTTNHPHLLASVCDARTSRLCVLLFWG